MKKEIAEAWVKDLRTNPPQCKGQLYIPLAPYHDDGGYCCMGRLAIVLDAPSEEWEDDLLLGPDLVYAAGMKGPHGKLRSGLSLVGMNDNGVPFSEIADVIEKNWKSL